MPATPSGKTVSRRVASGPSLRRWLRPLSAVYGGLVRVRNRYFDIVPAARQRADVPVISVGNITVGGTGKTPMVIEIVRRLRDRNRRPAILTRGYKARPGEEADEVLEFRDALGNIPIVVNADRVSGATAAVHEHGADCLVMDDGFQHRRLARDLDIVLIDALRPWGGGTVLPAGRLREPLRNLRRADLFIITRANQVAPRMCDRIRAKLARLASDKPIVAVGVEPDVLIDLRGQPVDIATLGGRRVLAVCGLGNPATFVELVRPLAGDCQSLVFADHQHYGDAQVERIRRTAAHGNADVVVTTRKDWVKLVPQWRDDGPPLLRLDVRPAWLGDTTPLDDHLRQALEKAR